MIYITQRDITDIGDGTPTGMPYYNPDCIVNASNQELIAGAGVSGAIHEAAGMQHSNDEDSLTNLEQDTNGIQRLAIGSAILQNGHALCPWVVQTHPPSVNEPNWKELLGRSYDSCVQLWVKFCREHYGDDSLGQHSIAFPMLGTGAYRLPATEANGIAVEVMCRWQHLNWLDIWLVVGPGTKDAQELIKHMYKVKEVHEAMH